PPQSERQEVVFLGAAGQRIISAGEILGLAALSGGLHASQKNEYNVTVLRGPSIAELILSPEPIDYNGSMTPSIIMALANEGVERRQEIFSRLGGEVLILQAPGVKRRQEIFSRLGGEVLILQAPGVKLPPCAAQVTPVDFKAMGIKRSDWALASLAVPARMNRVLTWEMLEAAVEIRFQGKTLAAVQAMIEKVTGGYA
ncbi:MAG: 2-oxoacid:acceptor oxidoreductase family protein, partial [Deltaproteobacteria bacterium]|nr:2-oxoacid:acceptor oxidoreductase family protein [Deltaproteobacteria bacterium]